MRWADANDLCIAWDFIDHDAFCIDSDRHKARSSGGERNAQWRIARIFDSHDSLAWDGDRSRDEIKRLLRARRCKHVLRPACDCAGNADVLGNCVPQLPIPLIALRTS
jgi:hypothetical protein